MRIELPSVSALPEAGSFSGGSFDSRGVRVGSSGWQPRDYDPNEMLAPEGPSVRIPQLESNTPVIAAHAFGVDFAAIRVIGSSKARNQLGELSDNVARFSEPSASRAATLPEVGSFSGAFDSGGVRVSSSGWQPRDCDANHILAPEGPAVQIHQLEIKPANHFFACLRYGLRRHQDACRDPVCPARDIR
ncbi:hypothetical protein C2E31_07290 [Rhodopirellula baltica]|nr:hypothetical protein C2E31_07290 [Rhodopirellula baltica]